MRTAVVFNGGPRPDIDDLPEAAFAAADLVVAVDSGLHTAQRCGRRVDVVLGDMDSVEPEALALARSDGAEVIVHPTDKDATDLELALREVRRRGSERVGVIGAADGRLDHLLASTAVLCAPEFESLRIEAHWGPTRLVPIHASVVLRAHRGATVSLLPIGGDAHGVRTDGLRWVLDGDTLRWGASLGVSNEFLGDECVVEVTSGVLVAVVVPDIHTATPSPSDREVTDR